MSELRSAIESLRSENLTELPDARIEEDFSELQRAAELIDAERLRRLAEIERRGLYSRDGHLSTASWLASRFKLGWGAAREQVRTARALDEMPHTRRALDDGELSMSAVRVLVGAREADPDAFRINERQLVEAACIHSMHHLRRVAAYWRQAVEREAALGGEEKLREQRRLHASVTFLGMVRVDGHSTPRPARPFRRRSRQCWMPNPGRDPRMTARRRSGALTPSVRSAASGSTSRTGPRLPESART